MNDISNKSLQAGENACMRCMSEMHLRQPQFTYSASGQGIQNIFTKMN